MYGNQGELVVEVRAQIQSLRIRSNVIIKSSPQLGCGKLNVSVSMHAGKYSDSRKHSPRPSNTKLQTKGRD